MLADQQKQPLSKKEMFGYALGSMGYSILFNIISVMLIYFYVPPDHSGINPIIPNIVLIGSVTGLSLIIALSRLSDAITDPIIAFMSDRSGHEQGRRIPFMRWAILPTLVFCLLIFIPLHYHLSWNNLWWLLFTLFFFYLSLTFYMVPFSALLPEIAHSKSEKINYSALLSVGYVTGIIISSQTPVIADIVEDLFTNVGRMVSLQIAIGLLVIVAGICLLIPTILIDEKKHCIAVPISISLKEALRQTIANRNFLLLIGAELLYFIAISMVVSGMLYYLTVLLLLPESMGGAVMGVMVIVSLFFYPAIVSYSKKHGYKFIVISGLITLAVVMGGVFFMGRVPINPTVQIFAFGIIASYPLAALGILPQAILADIADQDSVASGQQKEGMYFAIRNFSTKIGQTFGLFIFAMLTIYGKDLGDDLGIRLSGVFGMAFCLLAALIFMGFKENISKEKKIPEGVDIKVSAIESGIKD